MTSPLGNVQSTAVAQMSPGAGTSIVVQSNSGNATGFIDAQGQSHSISPPIPLSQLATAITNAAPGSPLAAMKGQDYSCSAMLPASTGAPPTVPNVAIAPSSANVCFQVNNAQPPTVTGITINGQPGTLPPDFAGKTPAQCAQIVTSASLEEGSSASTLAAALQGSTYATTQATAFVDNNGSVVGFQGPDGTTTSLLPQPGAMSPADFQAAVANAPAGSALHSLQGLTLAPQSVSYSFSATTSSMTLSANGAALGTESPPPPNPNIVANPYLQPSIGAQITILLMNIDALKMEVAHEEDKAIINTMQNSIDQLGASLSNIAAKNALEGQEAAAAIAAAAISIAGAVVTVAMTVGATRQRNAADEAPKETKVANIGTTTPPPTGAGAISIGGKGAAAGADGASATPDTAEGAKLQTDKKIDAHAATVADTQQEIKSGQPTTGGGAADPLVDGTATDQMAGYTPVSVAIVKGGTGKDKDQVIGYTAGETKDGAPPAPGGAAPGGAAPGGVSIGGSAKTDPAKTDPAKTTPAAKTPAEHKANLAKAERKYNQVIQIARSLGDIFNAVGKITENGVKLSNIAAKTVTQQTEASLSTAKQINEMYQQQLVGDRSQLDTEFRGTLDVLKQMMDQELKMQGSLLGVH